MKFRRVAGVVAVLVLLGWLALYFTQPKQPIYQGKTLTQWLQQYEADRTVAGEAVCERAINAIGTNAIPTLIRLLTAKDFPRNAALQKLVDGVGFTRFHGFDPTYKRRLAAIGFQKLGQTAKSATPKLIELIRHSRSPLTRQYALWSLEEMNCDKDVLLPLLTESLHDANQDIANFAAEQLYRLAPEDAQKAGAGKLLPLLNLPATNTPGPKK